MRANLPETDQLGRSCFQEVGEGYWHELGISGVNECFWEAELTEMMKDKSEKNIKDGIQEFYLVHSGDKIVQFTENTTGRELCSYLV